MFPALLTKKLIFRVMLWLAFTVGAFSITSGRLNLSLTNDLLWRHNLLSNRSEQVEDNLTLLGQYRRFSAGVTLRGYNFFRQDPNRTLAALKISFLRKFVQYASPTLKVQAGDFYAMLGRGLVLSVLQDEKIFRERTVLGGNVTVHRRCWNFRALGGVVTDELQENKWAVAGGEVVFSWQKEQQVGLHASFIDDVKTNSSFGRRWAVSLHASGDNVWRFFRYYAEYARLQRVNDLGSNGQGWFAGLTFHRARWTVMLESKRYLHFGNELNNPPLADREEELNNLDDSFGGRIYLQYALPGPDLVLFGNAGWYREYASSGPHFYGGFRLEDLWDRLNFTASYGVRDVEFAVRRTFLQLIYQLSQRWSIETYFKEKRYTDLLDSQFVESDLSLQLGLAPQGALFCLYQYSHRRIEGRRHFLSGGLRCQLARHTNIEVVAGWLRGGQICAGGQCFFEPPFHGIKVSLLSMFQ